MERGTRLFWSLIAALLGASVYFGARAEHRRRAVQAQRGATVENGDLVEYVRAVDGDSLVVANEADDRVSVRLLGVDAFDPDGKDAAAMTGKLAVQTLEKWLADEPARVALHSTPKDRHGRYLAELYVGERNVGLGLVEEGLALVYTKYPFPAMNAYLDAQQAARSAREGLWANEDLVGRAELLSKQWRRQRD